jgi:hypothetical protein
MIYRGILWHVGKEFPVKNPRARLLPDRGPSLRKHGISAGLRHSEVLKRQESDINRYILSRYLGIIIIGILLILYPKNINNYFDLQVVWYHKFIC